MSFGWVKGWVGRALNRPEDRLRDAESAPARKLGATVHGMDDGDDWLTEHYDALEEEGLAEDPAA
ncbi:hypothetical protein [Gordonia sp. VNK21]|uniref:hypothetical protein n=1 Tax=Gordonia sp. VNK21 TaxID=3382483 RepID=UPI0038D3A5A2